MSITTITTSFVFLFFRSNFEADKLFVLACFGQHCLQQLHDCTSLKVVEEEQDQSSNAEASEPIFDRVLNNISNFHTSSFIHGLLEIDTYTFSYPKYRAKISCRNHTTIPTSNDSDCRECKLVCKDCVNMVNVCCDSCHLCMKCLLSNLNLQDWHELVAKLVDGEEIGDICEITVLRLSILITQSLIMVIPMLAAESAKKEKIYDPTTLTKAIQEKMLEKDRCNYPFALRKILMYLKANNRNFKDFDMHIKFLDHLTNAKSHIELNLIPYDIKKHFEFLNEDNSLFSNSKDLNQLFDVITDNVAVSGEKYFYSLYLKM